MKGASVRTLNFDGMAERSFTMPRFRRFFHCAACLDRARDGPEIPAGKHSTRNGTSGVRGHLRILRSDGTYPSICRFYCFYRRKTFRLSSFFHEKRKKIFFLPPTRNSRQHFACFTDHVHFDPFKRTDRPTCLLSTHTVLHNSAKKSNPKLRNLEIFPEFFKIFAEMYPNETKK